MVRSRPDVLCQGRVVCRSRQQAAIDMEGTSCFIVELFLLCTFVCLACGQNCSSEKPTAVKSTVKSQRNQPGNWIPQVRIEHGVCDNTVTISTWTAEVEQNTTSCNCVESEKQVTNKTAPKRPPWPGYILHTGFGYYKIHSVLHSWHQARYICEQEGAHLAIINSEEESKILQSMFTPVNNKVGKTWAFIGFHDLYEEGQYLTVFDEPLRSTGFYRWADSGQPDNSGGNNDNAGEECGSMHVNGGLNDLWCYRKSPFICEQEL